MIKTDIEYKSESSIFGCCCYCNKKKKKGEPVDPDAIFWDLFVIPENSVFIRVFNKFILILKAVSSIAYFYFAIFRMHPDTDFKIPYYLYVSYGFESIFALDIILNFIKEFTPT